MGTKREIRPLAAEELGEALDFVWGVFAECEAPALSDEGIEEFWRSIDYEYMLHRFGEGEIRFWGAFEDEELAGVCAVRGMEHIALLYVDSGHQRQGIGTNLLKHALVDCKEIDEGIARMTVRSSPAAQAFYQTLGFVPLGPEQEEDGMRFVPMELKSL